MFVGALDQQVKKRVLDTNVRTMYADPGYLFFIDDGALIARPFDIRRLELTGDPSQLATHVALLVRGGLAYHGERTAEMLADPGWLYARYGES